LQVIAWMVAPADPVRAAALLGAAQNEWDKIETSTSVLPGLRAFHADCESRLREALGDVDYEGAFAAGQSLTQETAVDYAIGRFTAPAKAKPSPGAVASRQC